ncbi:hypothetical protein MKW94_007566 [Papaver nudicaule]|uniref:Phytosulfokine n=1 Tax=Papaver nudicaule TaxID=74823 RepID=A0AA41VHK5_PAPNU|nr:hypothetical protein [Papaver nudicaule]
MKSLKVLSALLFFSLLISFNPTTAFRPSKSTMDENLTVNWLSQNGPVPETLPKDSMNLIGAEEDEEECGNGDEECLKRRLIAEAHLDYIYTQRHHKP